jgi:prophage maintenance system killer protein/predicted transcriptional regulator
MSNDQIIIYKTEDNKIQLEARYLDEDIWLSQKQIAELFGVNVPAVNKHLKNIFTSGELDEESVISKMEITAKDGKKYMTSFYNLSAIISVGYRVNSLKATHFRIWSTSILKEFIKNDFVINKTKINQHQIEELQQTIKLLSNTLKQQNLVDDMGKEVINIIEKYSRTWNLLLRYDEERLDKPTQKDNHLTILELEEAKIAIQNLKSELINKNEASNLFGNMKDKQLESILLSLNQSFAASYLYSINIERAAHLLYFVIKDHPFSDGNKRIACLLFLIFMKRAKLQMPNNNTLIALALLIAESDPKQKDLMIKLIMNLINI